MMNTLLILTGTTSIITIGATICILRKIKNLCEKISLHQMENNIFLEYLSGIDRQDEFTEINTYGAPITPQLLEYYKKITEKLRKLNNKSINQPKVESGPVGFIDAISYPNLNKETVGYPSIGNNSDICHTPTIGLSNKNTVEENSIFPSPLPKKKLSHYTKTQKKKLALKKEYPSLPAFLHLKKEMPIQKKWLFNTYTEVMAHTFQNLPPTRTITLDEMWEIVKEHQKMDLIKERYSGYLPRKRVACQAYFLEKRIPHIHRIGMGRWVRDDTITKIKKGYKNAISQ